jgi:hypothetical protein
MNRQSLKWAVKEDYIRNINCSRFQSIANNRPVKETGEMGY